MNVIQVGLGDFGFSWLRDILLNYENIKVIAVVDKNQRSLEKAKALQGMEDVILFQDLEQALTTCRPDFILNVTPPGIHKNVDFIAFERGIPVLSEKPIAESFDDAVEIAEKAAALNVPIMIAENYRYNQVSRMAKKLLASGEIGTLTSVQVDFQRNHKMENYHKDLAHPLLLDVTIHHMDLMRYFTGAEARSVLAKAWTPAWSWYKGYANLNLLLEMEGEIQISYRGSLSSFHNETDWMADWQLEGEAGIMKISRGKISILKKDSETEIRVSEAADSRKFVVDEFIHSLKRGVPGETDIQDNMKTYQIAQAAKEAIEKEMSRGDVKE